MDKLQQEIVKEFGMAFEDFEEYEELYKSICKVVVAQRYAGDQGDNPLCILNRALQGIK